jgi:DNA polymerase III alpha subunit
MRVGTDIDIDVADRDGILEKLKHRVARIDREGDKYDKHNTGVYFQDIPYDPFTNMATIDHKKADEMGYFKIDLLNVHLYKDVKNEEHVNKLVNQEPVWELLEHKEVVERLFHLNNYYELCKQHKPKNIEQLAMLLAIIRPGKAHLQGKSWEEIEKDVWTKPTDGSYYFKKSHSFGYAMVIVLQLNLMAETSTSAS